MAQEGKQAIASYLDASMLERYLQQIMQLAGAHTRLSQALMRHQRHHRAGLRMTPLFVLTLLVVRLTTHADMAARCRHIQALDEPLREDPPEGFFTTRTP